MTPLHVLCDEVCDRATLAVAGLSYAEIARAAGMKPQQLNNLRKVRCSADSLERVFAAIRELTGLRLDVGLVELPAEKS